MLKKITLIFLSIFLFACTGKEKVDFIVNNAVVYTLDSGFSIAQSFAVKDGKILAVGTDQQILAQYTSSKILMAQGKAIYPGFIDAHCHFYRYGNSLQQVDLVGTSSFKEVLQRVSAFSGTNNPSAITGRGWDQNDWVNKAFPDNHSLDSLFPQIPVVLERVDGHALLANTAALVKAGIKPGQQIAGGVIETKNGKLTGILIDNAIKTIRAGMPVPTKQEKIKALLVAQQNCFAVGLTTVDDAGLEKDIVDLMDELQKADKLKMRIYAMLTDNKENLDHYLKSGTYKTPRLNVSSFKFYGDGALGSRGACLLKAYSDKPGEQGFLLNTFDYYINNARLMAQKGFQMNTHCIGDSANRLMLDIYGAVLKANNNKRWRIEHAQVIDSNDFKKFAQFNIIPSVQTTHCTSDMYWAAQRLGNKRIKGAYAYNDLLKQYGKIALGTDFPVEAINPLYTFYAAISRQDLKGSPVGGFQPENALSREEALKGMTIWAAYANFEENEKGSIEPGKYADFVMLDADILKVPVNQVPHIKVIGTFINGEKVY